MLMGSKAGTRRDEPADDHTLNVFDAAIRGKTDRAVFRFKKPN